MERSVRTSGAEGAVDWMERYGIHGVHVAVVVLKWIAVAFEGEVGTWRKL